MIGTFKDLSQGKRIIIDIETKDPFLKTKGASWAYGSGYILGIGIKVDAESAEYYPLRHEKGNNIEKEKMVRYLSTIPNDAFIVGHFLYYDCGWLFNNMGYLHRGRYRDTLLTSQLYDNTVSHSLANMCNLLQLGEKSNIGDPTKIYQLPIETVAKYCIQDVELTAKLDDRLWKERDSESCTRECQLIPILVQMKNKGIKIDQEQLSKIQKYFQIELDKCLAEIPECKNIWSGASVAAFFRRFNISYPFTKLGAASFPNWYLDSISHPKIQALAKARKLYKLINTFCVGIRTHIADDGKIHPDLYNGKSEDGGTVTGRFSSANPNIQQQPNRTEEGMLLRSVYVPENLIWYKFDYKQQEPNLMMHYASKLNLIDDKWRQLFQNPDADFYEPIQKMMAIERFPAKTITLARCYNMGYEKLARMLHISEELAKDYLLRFDKSVPWLIKLKRFCVDRANEKKQLKTLGGRYLRFNNYNSNDAFNHLIQGSAADQIKQAMLDIYNNMRLIPLIQVHDELNYDITEEQMFEETDIFISQYMINSFKLDFPVRVDGKYGHNWKECS
jgi:DNA polymerase-1